AHAGVVLLGAAHPVGKVIGGRDVVELGGGVVLVGPGLAAVGRDVRPTVVPLDHALRIVPRDPHVVVVPVRIGQVPERGPAVGRLVGEDVGGVDDVGVLGVREDARVVTRALPQLALAVDVA